MNIVPEPVEPRGAVPEPPTTGHHDVDAALAGLADLEAAPLDEHPERLARAHEILHRQLQDDRPS